MNFKNVTFEHITWSRNSVTNVWRLMKKMMMMIKL